MLAFLSLVAGSLALQHPEGPAQHCYDDAGPPWTDDSEHFGDAAYFDGSPATPWPSTPSHSSSSSDLLACPPALESACESKSTLAAHLDGPVDCGGKGWFCRITDQPGWSNSEYEDRNFGRCNDPDGDYTDQHGHCHGSDVDSTYGWWIRDHWFRGYAGTLTCCCDWSLLKGLVNRCDYRRFVDEGEAGTCRDANEEHGKSYEDGCAEHADIPYNDPADSADGGCWVVTHFADPESVDGYTEPPPSPSPPPPGGSVTSSPPPSPSPPPPEEEEPDPAPSEPPTPTPTPTPSCEDKKKKKKYCKKVVKKNKCGKKKAAKKCQRSCGC